MAHPLPTDPEDVPDRLERRARRDDTDSADTSFLAEEISPWLSPPTARRMS